MTSKKSNARPLLAALPSVTVPDLAEQWGVTIDDLGEYIKTGLLTCHVLLHELVATVKPAEPFIPHGSHQHHYSYTQAAEVTLNGHYRLPVSSAAARGEGRDWIEIVYEEPDKRVRLEGRHREVRVLRDEVERFEREVLALPSPGERPLPPNNVLAQARCRTVAGMLWDRDHTLTYEDVIGHPDFQKYGIADFAGVTFETYHDWIQPLCPNHNPGRRPKKTPDGKPPRR